MSEHQRRALVRLLSDTKAQLALQKQSLDQSEKSRFELQSAEALLLNELADYRNESLSRAMKRILFPKSN